MAGTTASPENIPYVTGTDLDPIPSSFTPVIAQQIHNRLKMRQRYTFEWADSAAREAQTGMVQGSLGYQSNTKTDYIYDNGEWVLALPYAEFNAGAVGMGDGDYTAIGIMNFTASQSTSASMALSTTTSGTIIIANPGIYAVTMFFDMSTATVGKTRFGFSNTTSASPADGLSAINTVYADESRGFVSHPCLRLTAANSRLYFWVSKRTGGAANVATQVRVSRVG